MNETKNECIAEGHDLGDCCDIDCPSKRHLHLYRHDDSERTWISARSPADAAEVFSEKIDHLDAVEKNEIADEMKLIPDDEPVTVYDGSAKSTKTAAQWAAQGRGVVASTCE